MLTPIATIMLNYNDVSRICIGINVCPRKILELPDDNMKIVYLNLNLLQANNKTENHLKGFTEFR